jgi:hypothetical protein
VHDSFIPIVAFLEHEPCRFFTEDSISEDSDLAQKMMKRAGKINPIVPHTKAVSAIIPEQGR